MNIRELHRRINHKRETTGLGQLNAERYIQDISILQYQGKIQVHNGEVQLLETGVRRVTWKS